MKNFSKCVESQAFLEKSSASVMMQFLSDEDIESDDITEEQILRSALIWLKFDWEQRKVHAVNLLKKIRIGMVPLDRLKEILREKILAIPECKDMVEEAVKLSVTKDTTSLIKSHPELFSSRNTIKARLISDNYLDHSCSGPIVSFTCKTDTACYKITNLANIPNQYPYSAEKENVITPFVSDKNQLYLAINIEYYGLGEDLKNHEEWLSKNNFFQYLSEKNEWSVLSPMPKVVRCPRMVQREEYIYLIGDSDMSDDHSNCCIQRYSIPVNPGKFL